MTRSITLRRSQILTFLAGAVALIASGVVVGPVGAQDRNGLPPGIGIRLVDAPVDRRDDPRASLYIIDHLAPGATITRHIEVSNGTDAPVHLLTYAAAAEIEKNAFKVIEGRSKNELTEWTKVTPAELDLAVGQRKQATVTITVPADASSGERYAVALAELPGVPGEGNVAIASRVGVRLYISVGPGGEPPSSFVIDEIVPRREPDGTPVIGAIVTNDGGHALDLSGSLTLEDGPGGLKAGPFPAKLGTALGIGQSAPVEVLLDKQVPAGPWKAKITLRSGLLEKSADGTITFPKAGVGTGVKAKSSGSGSPLPIIAGGALGGVIGLFLFFFWRRRRKEEEDEDGPSVPAEPVG